MVWRTFSVARVKHTLVALAFVLLCLGYVLQAVGIHFREQSPPDTASDSFRDRRNVLSKPGKLRQSKSDKEEAQELKLEMQKSEFVDVPRLQNRASLAMARSMLLNGSLMNHDPLRHIKSSLKDPRFAQKLREMEMKRQEAYLRMLRDRGQLIELEGGGRTIVSFPHMVAKVPNTLKGRRVEDWTEDERIWLNITHFPWPLKSDSCKKFSVTFAPSNDKLPIVGLVSYPSSGNTWLRYLIESSSGYFSGSMYSDIMLTKRGFYGEAIPADSGLTVVVKSHGHTTGKAADLGREEQVRQNHMHELNSTAIMIVRNPFAAIIGHRHLDDGGHTGYAKKGRFEGEGWDQFVRKKTSAWENLYTDWIDLSPSRNMVVHFELLGRDLERILREILSFLGLEVDDRRLKCTVDNNEGEFHRKKKISENEDSIPKSDPFTSEQRAFIKEAISRVDKKLRSRGHSGLPTQDYDYMEP